MVSTMILVPSTRVTAEPTGPRILATTATSIVFEVDVPQPTFDKVELNGQTYDRVSLAGYAAAGLPGYPELPQLAVTLGVPAEGDVTVRVLEAKGEDLPGAFAIAPAPTWTVQSDPETGQADAVAGLQAEYAPDADTYAQDSFVPEALAVLDETAFLRQQRVARVTLQPIQVNPARGQLKAYRYLRVELSFAAAQAHAGLGSTAGVDDAAFEPILRDQLLNYDHARQWRASRTAVASPATPQVYPGDTTRPWFKTDLRFSGLYKITPADLQGPDPAPLAAADPRRLQVWKDGQQLPVYFLGDNDASFEAEEQLLFYANVVSDIYSDTDVVWLTVGDDQAASMATADASPAGGTTEAFVPGKVHAEEDIIFVHDVPATGTSAYSRWYWAELSSLFYPSRTVQFVVPHPIPGGYNAQLTIRLAGFTDVPTANPDHRVRLQLNGQTLGEVTWDGKTAAIKHLDFSPALLSSGLNELTLLTPGGLPGVGVEKHYLDWFEISYRQAPEAVSDRLSFEIDGSGRREFQIDGFQGQHVVALDVSNPTAPIRLLNVQIAAGSAESPAETSTTSAAPALPADQPRRIFLPLAGNVSAPATASYYARFGLTISEPHALLVTTLESIHPVAPLSRDAGSAWRATTHQANYLLVTHRDFMAAAQTLAIHRRSQGLTVAVVDIQDIYDEFGSGQMDPQAIRTFVDYAYHNWQSPAPTYVMLLGDGHYDYRMVTGKTMTPNYIPPYYACVDPYICEAAIDNEFVTVSGADRLPDLAIGRLPANTLDLAMVMVNKIIGYETAPPSGAWRQVMTFVADNYRKADGTPDPAGNFEALTEGVIATLPPQYAIKRIYYDPYPNDDSGEPFRYRTAAATTAAIISAVNTGTLFLNYIGHASTNTWAHEVILQASDRARNDVLLMANGAHLPIVVDMACLSGSFSEPQYTGIEAKMLEWPQGGSVAGWGATGFGVATGHDWLHRGFYRAIFTSGIRTVGLAAVAGKQYLWTNGPHYDDLLDTFGLLGDPATRIAL
jgi:hypothetical protein